MAEKIMIGQRQVLLSARWLVPEGDTVEATFKDYDGDPFTLKVKFIITPEEGEAKEKPKAGIKVRDVEGIPTLEFRDWTSSLGSSTRKPFVFATASDGIELSCLANISKVGQLYRVDIQVMSGRSQ